MLYVCADPSASAAPVVEGNCSKVITAAELKFKFTSRSDGGYVLFLSLGEGEQSWPPANRHQHRQRAIIITNRHIIQISIPNRHLIRPTVLAKVYGRIVTDKRTQC